jgi:hypothetical protein
MTDDVVVRIAFGRWDSDESGRPRGRTEIEDLKGFSVLTLVLPDREAIRPL